MNKRPLILWSGGLDSTFLLLSKLQEGDVDVMYVTLENNLYIQKRERRAIAKIKALLADARLPGSIVNEYDFGYKHIATTKDYIYAQPPLWLMAAVFAVDPERHSEVDIGYVKYDDAWHSKTEIYNVYDALLKLACDGQEIVPLKFPFEWFTKQNVLDQAKDFVYYKQLIDLVYYCERGMKEPCGECCSCKRHEQEVGQAIREVRTVAVDMTDKYVQKEKEIA